LSAHVAVEPALQLLATGRRTAYLLKSRVTDIDEFVGTLDRVVQGGSVIDPALVQELVAARYVDDPLEALSARELGILAKLHLPATEDDQRRVDHRAALHDPVERAHELVDIRDSALQEVTGSPPRGQQLEGRFNSDVGRQHDDGDRGELPADHPGRVEPLGCLIGRHPDVHDHEVRLKLPDLFEQLHGVAHLTNNGKPGSLEQPGETLAQQHIVVGQYHTCGTCGHRHDY
jgi:hypothetical protein